MRRYGESERNLSEIFKAAEQLGGAIIFLDEIDSLATQRRCAPHRPPFCDPGRKCAIRQCTQAAASAPLYQP